MMPDLRDPQVTTAAMAVLAAGVALVYGLVRFNRRREEFGVIDVGIVVMALLCGAAAAVPLVHAAQDRASGSVLLRDLHIVRTQIEMYKAQHNGRVPLLYKGAFPQLTQATDAIGVPGTPGTRFPYGPYLRDGIPPNPFTGQSIVTAVDVFPPPAPTRGRGWIYHQPSGRIAADQEGYLNR
jgi:general secretion pathway protein G